MRRIEEDDYQRLLALHNEMGVILASAKALHVWSDEKPRPVRKAKAPVWVADDGGRAAAGFKGDAGDCVTRAFTIAQFGPQPTGEQYREVYNRISELIREWAFNGRKTDRKEPYRTGQKPCTPRNGVFKEVEDLYGAELGWPKWSKPFGPTVLHLHRDELPGGTLVCNVNRHLVAVIDGVAYDTWDSTVSRISGPGKKAVSSYWTKV